jgi:hypothetical protein
MVMLRLRDQGIMLLDVADEPGQSTLQVCDVLSKLAISDPELDKQAKFFTAELAKVERLREEQDRAEAAAIAQMRDYMKAMVLKKHSEDPVRYGRLMELVDNMAPGQLMEYWKADLIVDKSDPATKGSVAVAAAAAPAAAASAASYPADRSAAAV